MWKKCFSYCLIFSILGMATAGMSGSDLHAAEEKLIIGTKITPPFVIKNDDGNWQGISIELWQSIALDLGITYEYREYKLPGLLQAVETGEVDVAAAALTITAERESLFDFTHPFYITGLGIAVIPGNKGGWFNALAQFFSLAFLKVVAVLAILLGLVGLLVWFFERKSNPEQFGGNPLQGMGSGFWWSAVTMTTVGYGDKAPRTLGGRLVALAWMFAAIIVISSFTAAITSSLTIQQISQTVKGPEDLPRVRIGSVGASTSADYLTKRRLNFRSFASPEEGLQALAVKEIDAFVYDAPILKYVIKSHWEGRLTVLDRIFERQEYGFALPEGSPLREPVNRLMLKRIRLADWQALLYDYLGG